MKKDKDSTKGAMYAGLRDGSPDLMKNPNDSAEGAKTDFPIDPLKGVKFGIVLNGELIQSPRQLTVPLYESWARIAWESGQSFYSVSQKKPMPLVWDFHRYLPWWIDRMYALNKES